MLYQEYYHKVLQVLDVYKRQMLLWIICHAARGEWNEELSESYQQLLNFLCDVLDTHPDYAQSRSL